jgi:hypothetical protein
MPNHFHLLMEVKNINTSAILQRLLTSYTKHYNKKYKKSGHLFQGRYKSIICEKDNYLLELVRYIHLNPFRANLVKNPLDWAWSGHREYLDADSILLDSEEVLGMLSSNFKQALTQYSDFVREGSQMGKRKDYYPKDKLPYVGTENFIEELKTKHDALMIKRMPELRVDLKYSLRDLLKAVSDESHMNADSIVNGSRVREITNARIQFIKKALYSGHKGKDIADFVNCTESYITKVKK